jgi:hypothetical protein
MKEAFRVMPLTCDHCGRPLPVMGHYVTFQCRTCFRYWVLTADGLRPITVFRALPPAEIQGEPTVLPFWVIGIDCRDLRAQMERVLGGLRESTRTIATAEIDMEEEEFEGFFTAGSESTTVMKRARFLSEASRTKNVPSAAEIQHLLGRIESAGTFLVYVPAFLSTNTYAYLKVGRLFTRRQPGYRIEKSSGLGRPVLCALQADEAVSLVDYVFFATLPTAIQENGDFLEHIHLTASGGPRLIEFPFERSGSSLVSCIGGFHISARLIEGEQADAEVHAR